jgi:hypothetical protein
MFANLEVLLAPLQAARWKQTAIGHEVGCKTTSSSPPWCATTS